MGEFLTIWTARLSMGCYFARITWDLIRWRRDGVLPWQLSSLARVLWSVGCGIFVLHVLLAFGVYHHWSHAEAWEHTATRTRELTGWDSGVGLYFNYLILLLWLVDVVLHWTRETLFRWWYLGVQGFFAFMILNATVVFGSRGWVVVLAVWVILLWNHLGNLKERRR